MFAHGVSFQVQAIGVVNQPIEDGVGERGFVEIGIDRPVIVGDEGGLFVIAIVNGFEQIALGLITQGSQRQHPVRLKTLLRLVKYAFWFVITLLLLLCPIDTARGTPRASPALGLPVATMGVGDHQGEYPSANPHQDRGWINKYSIGTIFHLWHVK